MKRLVLVLLLLAVPIARAEDTAADPSHQLLALIDEMTGPGGDPTESLDPQIAEITRLLDAGASLAVPNEDGLTALHLAAQIPRLRAPDLIRVLLDKGASIDAPDAKGRTPLMLAAAMGHDPNIQFLVLAGANTAAEDTAKFTPLDHALQFGQRSPASPYAVMLLAKGPAPGSKGADPNHVAADGWTPLMRACQFSTGAAISTLIVLGADTNYVAPDGWTPITVAIASDDERYWMNWIQTWALREGQELPPDPTGINMYAAMLAMWSRGNAGSPERVWSLMRIDITPLNVAQHQASIDRVLKGRDDPSAAAVRALLALNDDLKARPIDMPIFGNDGAPIPEPE